MPTTENDRRNQQETVLANPSLPDHDRTKDKGMHTAIPAEFLGDQSTAVGGVSEGQPSDDGTLDEKGIAPPDQEFQQIIDSGMSSNQGRIPEDPNNWLTSDPEQGYSEGDPESRGDSLPDMLERDQH